MSGETAGNGLDATMRDFANGQKVFNRYTLIKTLGRGGMGVVWLARDDELERNVALKFLPELIIHDRAVLGDMKRETRRSLDLTHKNIVRIYDFVHSDQSGCISMEYIDGDTLGNLRADKPHKVFETHDLKDWTSQLCDALDYAHNHARIIHRDLKPANLMVNKRGDLKVSDFGISRSLSDSVSMLTMERGRSGTLVFMSPQQLDGERGSHLDDIYSFGATAYELLTSKPPFSSGNVDRQIREKIPPSMTLRRNELEVEGEPIDETWERVVAACLAKEPARRPQSFAEIAQKLEIASPKTIRIQQAAEAKSTVGGLLASVVALKSNRNALIAAGAAVIFIGSVAVWFFGFHKPAAKSVAAPVAVTQPAPASTSNVEGNTTNVLGGVMLKTAPRGATVTLGGMDAGKSPVTFKGIRAGKYPLRISLEGYTPVEREIEVKAGQFVDLGTITLVRGTEVTERPKALTERREETRPEPLPNNPNAPNSQLAVPLNDFGGG
jgi:protein kinase-like protein/PEGA domain-containing protein